MNAPDKAANEQLHKAIEEGNKDKVEALLRSGADPNGLSQDGWSPLLQAAVHGPEITELLLKAGADPNSATPKGYTPLHRAVGHANVSVATLLLANGADVTAADCGTVDALKIAEYGRHKELCDLIGQAIENKLGRMPASAKLVPADAAAGVLLEITASLIGHRITRLDLTLRDGRTLEGVRVRPGGMIEVPEDVSAEDIVGTAIPTRQD